MFKCIEAPITVLQIKILIKTIYKVFGLRIGGLHNFFDELLCLLTNYCLLNVKAHSLFYMILGLEIKISQLLTDVECRPFIRE